MKISTLGLWFLSLSLLGCLSFVTSTSHLDQRFGMATARDMLAVDADNADYHTHIRPLIETRCVVCHGCYDAPCQLKMESFEGIVRGAHKDSVYDGTRLLGAELTRLFEDADTTRQWRDKGFYPVLNERNNTPEANVAASTLARSLALKQAHPLPLTAVLPKSFTFDINRTQQCPKIEQFDNFEQNYPLWGMPYGLPALTINEHQRLMDWLAGGAQSGPAPAIDSALLKHIDQVEVFLNGDSLKQQLVSRYLYEHLFLASLYFEPAPTIHFKLVRSRTAPGEPIQRISTRRPFDDPEVNRVYYRLWHDNSSTMAKTLMPYALTQQRLDNWHHWFMAPGYEVIALPDYKPDNAANPFVTFVDIPVNSRYRFLLDEAEFTLMNFIKGPVCRGQIALNVIQDHFWVFFIDPDVTRVSDDDQFLADNSQYLHLPAEAGDTFRPLTRWMKYADRQKRYLEAKAEHTNKTVNKLGPMSIETLWDGDGSNDNAALTIFRHNDSASVVRGLIGPEPKTAWVIGYPLLERIHYLLVAGFDVYGNVSHQLLSRMYMDFLRIEGEMNLLSFLPPEAQTPLIQHWYRGAEKDIQTYLDHYLSQLATENIIHYTTDNPKSELLQQLQARVAPAFASSAQYQGHLWPSSLQKPFEKLQKTPGRAATLMPEASILHVPGQGNFTLLRTSAHSNLSALFGEEKRRLPDEDSIIVVRGIIGAYPNSFLLATEKELGLFAQTINGLTSEADYHQFRGQFGIRRADPDFWRISDEIHSSYYQQQPSVAALLDYNRLENR
ncbi:MAG TPA: fatty acid cis/trans isomerase [Cellvibrionaceae bacterium]